jgi:hypothetical protein
MSPEMSRERLTAARELLERSFGAQFLVALLLILILKGNTLTRPPVWDTAMGLFPAAITLADNGFDVVELLGMPDYFDGGPNTHSTSPVTLVTAVVLKVSGGGVRALVILHFLHFAVAALALTLLFRLARPVFGDLGTFFLCLSVLLHPTFNTQVGFLYMEVPLFLCAVGALHAFANQRFRGAVLWSALAYATKEAGIIVPATLAGATLLEGRGLPVRLKRAGVFLLFPALWTVTIWYLSRLSAGGSAGSTLASTFSNTFGGFWHYLDRFLLNVPDVLILILVFVGAAVFFGTSLLRVLTEELHEADGEAGNWEARGAEAGDAERRSRRVLGYSGIMIVLFLLLFFFVLPIGFSHTIILPRYYVVILPFLLMWTGYVAQRLGSSRLRSPAAVCFAVLCGFFALNWNGALYPMDIDTEGPGNDPALTERSNAYRRLQAIEMEAIGFLETLPAGVPVYYGHYEHYLFSYPELGYASAPLSNGHNFSVESLAELIRGEPFPPCVYALFNYPWSGGEKIRGLIRFAADSPNLTSEVVREFRDGRYVIVLIRVANGAAVCPS